MAITLDRTSLNINFPPYQAAVPDIEKLNHKTFQYCPSDIALPVAAKVVVRLQLHAFATCPQYAAQYNPITNCCCQTKLGLAVPTFPTQLHHDVEKFQSDEYVAITTALHVPNHDSRPVLWRCAIPEYAHLQPNHR